MSVTAEKIFSACKRIESRVVKTPLIPVAAPWTPDGSHVFLKLENRQYTGSFKARGALNKILTLEEQGYDGEIITASTGNHGLGVARAISFTTLRGSIYVPRNISGAKLKKLEAFDVNIEFVNGDPLTTEMTAKETAAKQGAVWISPYNDPDVIAGQGTIGIELMNQLEEINTVYITVGGGGLMSGVATWIKQKSPKTRIIGCLPAKSPEMKLSVDAGHIVHLHDVPQTLSDGSAGGCEDDSITFPICRALTDQYILVEEHQIARAIQQVYHDTGERIEGSAGVAVAAMQMDATGSGTGNVVCIICGGNIEDNLFKEILSGSF